MESIRLNSVINWHNPDGYFDVGRYCVVIKPEHLDKFTTELKDLYPEIENPTLKIFKGESWADTPMPEAIASQNIFASIGMAPKVYDIVDANSYTAQIVPYIDGEPASKEKMQMMWDQMRHQDTQREWHMKMTIDLQKGNMRGGKWLDFQGIEPSDSTRDAVVKEMHEVANWQPIAGKISYQDMPGFVSGKRKMGRIDEDIYTGKAVLDIGSSGGAECIAAERAGVKKVFGVDTPEITEVASRVAALFGAPRINYIGMDLKDELADTYIKDATGRTKFDVILFLSMHMHIGFPDWITDFMDKDSVLIFEGNRDLDNPKYEKSMEDAGLNFKKIGESHDLGARTIWEARL